MRSSFVVVSVILVSVGCYPRQDETTYRNKIAAEKAALAKWQREEREKQQEAKKRYRAELEDAKRRHRLYNDALSYMRSAQYRLTDEHLLMLGAQSHMTSLSLRGTSVTDKGLMQIQEWRGLKRLDLSDLKGITDAGLTSLIALPRLRQISLAGTKITDKGLSSLARITSLENIDLSRTAITDAGIALLKSLPKLKEVKFALTNATGAGFARFPRNNQISSLSLVGVKISVDGVRALNNLRRLKRLELRNSSISDAHMALLGGFASLDNLDLRDTKVGDAGIAAVAAMPHLSVIWFPKGVTAKGLRVVRGLPRFKLIDYSFFPRPLTDSDISAMASKHIRHLKVYGKQHGVALLGAMRRMPNLQSASLTAVRLSAGAFMKITNLTKLQALDVAFDTPVDPSAALSRLKNLERLSLMYSGVTTGGVALLAKLKLRYLNITLKGGSAKMIPHFKKMKKLRQLFLQELTGKRRPNTRVLKKVTGYRRRYTPSVPAWVYKLQRECPRVQIWWNRWVVRPVHTHRRGY